jgi:ParB-like chromosome segregation protein Spo0J
VAADRVVHAVLPRVLNRKPPKAPKTPRVAELLRKAIEWPRQLDAGEVRNQAEIARREGLTRARVTQVLRLLLLAPEIQEHALSLPDMVRRPAITGRALRPIAHMERVGDQKARFQELVQQAE